MSDSLRALRVAGVLSALDEQLAVMLGRMAGEGDERVLLAIALVSRQVAQGHVCLPLAAVGDAALSFGESAAAVPVAWPPLGLWRQALQHSVLVGRDLPGSVSPLVLDAADRLYLRRYFEHERRLAEQLAERMQRSVAVDEAALAAGLQRLFPDAAADDLQRTAAEVAARGSFTVISGGPGTGKTSTVAKILVLIAEQATAQSQALPRIALMAPTGKAAVRLREAMLAALANLQCSDEVRAAIAQPTTTIHRALSAAGHRWAGESRAGHARLPAEVVLVDEASMVDLELMARLSDATPPGARLILLGDRHQLASVQAGAVLGDICGSGLSDAQRAQAPALTRSVVQLTRSYRYAEHSGIGELARAINAGDVARTLELLRGGRHSDVALHEPPPSAHGLSPQLTVAVLEGFGPCLTETDPARALAALERFRVLCAHRRGPRGVVDINQKIAELLFERGLTEGAQGQFHGRPILITENDYRNGLWNGDVGLVWRAEPGAALSACFAGAETGLRWFSTARLPPHETAFAQSVHKSQGSEVDALCVVLPERPSPVLTRELLYTAVTRARRRVAIHSSVAVLSSAVVALVARSSGLRDALYSLPPGSSG